MTSMIQERQQAIAGLVPPQQGEAIIRVAWPSVARFPAIARLGQLLTRSIVLAPFAWILMAPFYFIKILPHLACRYTITNRRVTIERRMKHTASGEILLSDIDEVRIKEDGNTAFFRAADIELVSKGEVKLRLDGVPSADAFRHAIINACMAWVPGKASAFEKFVSAAVPK